MQAVLIKFLLHRYQQQAGLLQAFLKSTLCIHFKRKLYIINAHVFLFILHYKRNRNGSLSFVLKQYY